MQEENRASKEEMAKMMAMFRALARQKEEEIIFKSDSDDTGKSKQEGKEDGTPQRQKKSRPIGTSPPKNNGKEMASNAPQTPEEGSQRS